MKSIDYRDFSDGKNPPAEKVNEDLRWWEKKGRECADSITSTINTMDRNQVQHISQLVTSARLYGNAPMVGAGGINYSRYSQIANTIKERLSYNVVQAAVDTVTAKISKNKPKPYFLTSGGDYKVQRKAKKLNQFVEGIFYECDAYALGEGAFRDGAIMGDGLIHVYERDGRVAMERVLGTEIFVDETDGYYGRPRQMHRMVNVDRDVLKAFVDGKKKEIQEANPAPTDSTTQPTTANEVRVRESWHLPSGPDAKDGRHVISIAGEVLLSEEWKHDFFPFARFQWCPRLWGFWSQGLAEQIQNIQIEINKILWVVQRAFHLSGGFKILVENGSRVVKEHLNNDVGTLIMYTGKPPEYITPPPLPPEYAQHLEQLKRAAFEQAGVSELSANSQKPAGLNSGKALREFNDIESDRFTTIGKAYERFYLDLARLCIATARGIAEREGKYPVKVPRRNVLAEIDWSEIDLTEDDYTMQCFPVSSLPNEPAGRFQTVQEWVQAGWYTVDQAKRLMDFPDIDAVNQLTNAMEDRLQEILDGIVDDGKYEPPQEHYNLQRAKELVMQYRLLGESQGLEPERMDMLIDFDTQIDAMLKAAMEAQQEQAAKQALIAGAAKGAMNGAPPQAVPEAPPTSDMLPNAPGAAA